MDAILIKLGESLGLSYSQDYLTLTGTYKTFKLYIYQFSNINSFTIKFPFTLDTPTSDYMTSNLVDTIRSKYTNVSKCELLDGTLVINLKGSNDETSDIKALTDIIDDVTDFASANALNSCCEICKLNLPAELHDIDNTLYLMCNDCHTKLENQSLRGYKKESSSANIITGTIGALLGSLLGVVLWVIIFELGYIASICGMVIAIGAMKGFKLFGGKLNNFGIIISILITIAMVYLSNYLSYSIDFYNYFKTVEPITVLESIKNLGKLIAESPDLKSEFNKNLLMGYGFTLLGAFSTFKNALKSKA